MYCYRILSIFVAIFLFISLAAGLVSIWSLNWWTGEFEAVLPLQNKTNQPVDELHWLFAVRYGLTKVCWKALQPRRLMDPDNYEIIPPLRRCNEHNIHLIEEPSAEVVHFRNILLCMAVGIIFNVLAFVFAFFDLPCIRRLKKTLMLLTILMSVFAAIAILIGLFIANDSLYYEADFMTKMRTTVPYFGPDVSDQTKAFLATVFDNFSGQGLSQIFEKGWSFIVGCVAEVFLLLAIIFGIIENCCYQRVPDREYLVEDDGKKAKL